jgi:hypothetical protein
LFDGATGLYRGDPGLTPVLCATPSDEYGESGQAFKEVKMPFMEKHTSSILSLRMAKHVLEFFWRIFREKAKIKTVSHKVSNECKTTNTNLRSFATGLPRKPLIFLPVRLHKRAPDGAAWCAI